jgi:hypothetical protein
MSKTKDNMPEVGNEEFSDDYIPEANWKKWEKVGDSIKGTYMRKFFKRSDDGSMPDQYVFELMNVKNNSEACDINEVWKVPVKATSTYVLDRLQRIQPGQRIGFKFAKEIPAKKKGYNPAKSIQPYVWDKDPNYAVLQMAFGGADTEESMESKDEEIDTEGPIFD